MTSIPGTPSFTSNKRGDALPPPPPNEVCKALNIKEITIDWLAGDGSDRCYYRILSPELENSCVLMQLSGQDAKALLDNGYEWIQIGEILSDHGIYVPKTIATLPKYAAIIIQDYGNIMMESVAIGALDQGKLEETMDLYQRSFVILKKFLTVKPDREAPWCKRKFDSERFQWELNFFLKEYLENVAGIVLSESEALTFKKESVALSNFLASNSDHFVHRDFHSRNVMVKNEKLAVIDFQDARYGPVSYDLVSLCFDSYIPFEIKDRVTLVNRGIEHISNGNTGLKEDLENQWRAMLLQRQLKAIGSFGYLSVRKNRGNYLKYVKPALETLDPSIVFDERWPFISSKIIELIATSTK